MFLLLQLHVFHISFSPRGWDIKYFSLLFYFFDVKCIFQHVKVEIFHVIVQVEFFFYFLKRFFFTSERYQDLSSHGILKNLVSKFMIFGRISCQFTFTFHSLEPFLFSVIRFIESHGDH